jgi:hypothetical protein
MMQASSASFWISRTVLIDFVLILSTFTKGYLWRHSASVAALFGMRSGLL